MDKRNLDELLNTLSLIASYKSWLPLHLRGWVNALGLYVQERRAVRRSRLQAGGKFLSYIDAWCEEDGDWQTRKFDDNVWQLRFAHLVGPTYEIADFLNDRVHHFGDLDSDGAKALNKAVLHHKTTGSWLGLPRVPQDVIRRRAGEEAKQRKQEEAKKKSQEISYYEKRVQDNVEDSLALSLLALLYQQAGRYKDMENALKMRLKADASKPGFQSSSAFLELGKVYLAALSNSIRGKGIPIWGNMPADVTVQILGYDPEELRSLSKQNLSKAYEMGKQAGFSVDDLKELDLALKAATELSVEAFTKFDRYKEEEEQKEPDRLRQEFPYLFDNEE